MIKIILYWLLALLIIAFIAVWMWTGGIGRAWNASKSFTNIFDVIFFQGKVGDEPIPSLPWQPKFPAGPDISQSGRAAGNNGVTLKERYAELESQYETLSAQTMEVKTFGNPSPMRGQIKITQTYGAKETVPILEYIVLGADSGNTAPIDMTGWSLQSAYTGMRGYLPNATSVFLMGVVNKEEPAQLSPGDFAIVSSGPSPVGISFRENICTGYLEQLQRFYPSLPNSCPAPDSSLPMTPENLRIYGDTCFDFLESVPSCTAPLKNMPSNVSSNCRSFAINNLSYNGCVVSNRFRSAFATNSWRIYLDSYAELWRNNHDVIRLLDGEGRTVDAFTY